MEIQFRPVLRRSLTRLALSLVAILLLTVAISPFFLNNIAAGLLRQQTESIFGKQLTVGDIKVSLWRGAEILLKDVHLAQPPGYGAGDLLSAKKVRIRFQLFPMLKQKLLIDTILVVNPELNVVQLANGQMNIDYYLALFDKPADDKQPPMTVSLKRFEIKQAKLTLNSYALSKAQPTFLLYDVDFQLRNFILPNPQLSPAEFYFAGLLKASKPARVELKGQGVFIPDDINFTAQSRVEEFPLAEFSYLYPSPDINILAGKAWVTSSMDCRRNYLICRNHADVKGIKISGKKGGGKLVFGLPANLFIKLIQDKNGLLQLDFVVQGPLSHLQANTKPIVSSAISNAMRAKFGGVKSVGSKAAAGIKSLGHSTKKAFKKLFGK